MSSRRSAKVLTGVALLAVSAGGVISGADASAKKKPCKVKKEHKGCTLKKGAEYTADLLGGEIRIAVVAKGRYVIDLTSTFPQGGREGTVCGPVRKSVKGKLKIGKSYTFSGAQDGQAGSITMNGTFTLKSGGKTGDISGSVDRTSGGDECHYEFVPALTRTK